MNEPIRLNASLPMFGTCDDQVFFVYFVRDIDGVWRLDSM